MAARRRRVGQVNIIIPQDVRDVARWLELSGLSLASSVLTCSTLAPATRIAWATFKVSADAWLVKVQDVDWLTSGVAVMYEQGTSIAKSMRDWYDRLRAEGCNVPETPALPGAPFLSTSNPALVPPMMGDFLGNLPDIVKLGLAYLVLREIRAVATLSRR